MFNALSYTFQEINISHLGKRKIIIKMPFWGDMLVPWRVLVTVRTATLLDVGFSLIAGRGWTPHPLVLSHWGGAETKRWRFGAFSIGDIEHLSWIFAIKKKLNFRYDYTPAKLTIWNLKNLVVWFGSMFLLFPFFFRGIFQVNQPICTGNSLFGFNGSIGADAASRSSTQRVGWIEATPQKRNISFHYKGHSHYIWSNYKIPLFQGNLGWWNIIIWPDYMC